MAADLLAADRLTRAFGDRVAVRDVSLSVAAGEIVALLGPNGAGKTTTMRMLAGLIAPDAGTIAIDRVPMTRDNADQLRRSIGLLTETPGFWERLTLRANLITYARLYHLDNPDAHVTGVLEQVGLADRAGEIVGKLSKGLKQRAALARALMHRPAVVLLDEPTSGLDPASARHVRDVIAGLRDDGRAVLVSTHNLSEAEELADRIAVLKTTLLACDSPAALRGQREDIAVVIEFEDGSKETVTVNDMAAVADTVRKLVGEGRRIVGVSPDRRSLEEVYLSLVGAES